MTPRHPKASHRPHVRTGFLRHLLRAVPTMIVMGALTAGAQAIGLFKSFESIALDSYIATAAPRHANDVVIVTITDYDYDTLFAARSPLEPAKVRELIKTIIKGGPAVLGVDIATVTAAHADPFPETQDSHVVWVRDAIQEMGEESPDPRWRLDQVLGGNTAADDPRVGLSLFPRDADGFVRRYYRRLTLKTRDGEIAPASLPWAILQSYCRVATHRQCRRIREDAGPAGKESLWFNFAGDRYRFRKIAAGAIDQVPDSEFRDKIVLLGGTFAAARDLHPTPLGQVAGVELTAFAVQSELDGGGISEANHVLTFVIEVAIGIALVWLSWRWAPGSRSNAVVTSLAVVAFAVAGSYLAFRAFGSWVTFVYFGIGVWIEQLYHGAHGAKHAREQLEEYRRRYGTL